MDTVFIDESKTRGYTVAAAIVPQREIHKLRREVAKLRKRGQARVHMVKESDSRRRLILSTLCRLGLRVRIYHVTGEDDPDSRAACLAALVADAFDHGASRLVLERDDSIEKFDRRVLGQCIRDDAAGRRMTYAHEVAASEPLLWAADAVAWGYARGGEWRFRIAPLVDGVKDLSR